MRKETSASRLSKRSRLAKLDAKSSRRGGLLMAVAMAAMAAESAILHAATSTWTGGGTTSAPDSGTWSAAGNWSPTGAPASDPATTLVLGGTGGYAATDDNSGLFTVNSFQVSATGTSTIAANSGSSLSLGGVNPAITQTSSGTFIISAPIDLAAAAAVSSAGGTINFTGPVTSASSNGLTLNSTSGASKITFTGANSFNGLTINSNVNAVAGLSPNATTLGSGVVNLSGGTLSLQGQQTSGVNTQETVGLSGFNQDIIYESSTGTVTKKIDGSESLYQQGITNAPTSGADGLPSSGQITSAETTSQGNATYTGTKFQLQSYSADNALYFSGNSNPQTLALATPSQFSKLEFLYVGSVQASLTITATLNFTNNTTGSLTWGATDWYGSNSATALDAGSYTGSGAAGGFNAWGGNLDEADFSLPTAYQSLTISSITFAPSATPSKSLDIMAVSGYALDTNVTNATQSYANAVNVTNNSDIDVSGSLAATVGPLAINSSTLSVTSIDTSGAGYSLSTGSVTLSGNAGFDVKSSASGGAGTLVLGALNDGGIARSLTINPVSNGTLTLSASAASLVAGTAVAVQNGVLNSNASTALGTDAQVTLNNSAALNIGASQQVGGLSGGANTVISLGANVLTIGNGADNLSSNFAGSISGSGGIATAGSGTLTLSGVSTYSGGTAINSGTVVAAGSTSGAISNGPLGTGSITLGAGSGSAGSALLADSAGGRTIANNITVSAGNTGVATIGGLNTSGVSTFSGNVALGSASASQNVTLGAANGGEVDFTGNLTQAAGAASINVVNLSGTGSATVKLTGANTFTGGAVVNPNAVLASGLTFASNNTLGTGVVTLAGGELALQGQESIGAGTQQALSIASGFNADTIYDAAATIGGKSSASVTISTIDGGKSLAVDGYNSGGAHPGGTVTQGLPASGLLTSAANSNVTFQFGNYAQNNTAYFTSVGTSVTLALNTPIKMSNLNFLTDAQNQGSTFSVTLHFVGGGMDTLPGTVSAGAWAFSQAPSELAATGGGSGQVVEPNGQVDGGWPWFLGESDLSLSTADAQNLISSITIANTSLGGGYSAEVYAISGMSAGPVTTNTSQTYANNIAVTANSDIDVTTSLAANVGNVSIGSSTLSITSADASGNSYSLSTGSVTLSGNANFNASNSAGGGAGNLVLGSLNDGGTAYTIGFNPVNNGTVTLGSAATSLVNGTAINISNGAVNSNNATALGSVASVNVSTGATLNVGAAQTLGALSGGGAVMDNGYTLTVGNSANNLSSEFDGVISDGIGSAGSGGLTKAGAGALILGGNNTFTGPTLVSSGTLQLGAGGASGAVGGAIVNNATLIMDRSDTYTLTNAISGSGSFFQAGLGTTVINTANTYTGGTTISGGVLVIGNAQAVGTNNSQWIGVLSSPTVGGAVALQNGITLTRTIQLAGNGASGQDGALVNVSGVNTVTNQVLVGGSNAGVSSIASDGGTLVLAGGISNPGNNLTIGGAGVGIVSSNGGANFGSGQLTKAGSGTWYLDDPNTSYTGNLHLSTGTLSFVYGGLGNVNNINFLGGVLQYALGNTQDVSSKIVYSNSSSPAGVIAVDTNGNTNVTFASSLNSTNTRGLNKLGLGTLTLQAANTYGGGTTVTGGTLEVDGSIASTDAVNVGLAGALDGAGSVGAANIAGALGQTVGAGSGDFTLASAALQGGSAIDLLSSGALVAGNNAAPAFNVTGLLNVLSSGSMSISISNTSGLGVGTYDLFNYNSLKVAGATAGSPNLTSDFSYTAPAGKKITVDATNTSGAGSLDLVVANLHAASMTLSNSGVPSGFAGEEFKGMSNPSGANDVNVNGGNGSYVAGFLNNISATNYQTGTITAGMADKGYVTISNLTSGDSEFLGLAIQIEEGTQQTSESLSSDTSMLDQVIADLNSAGGGSYQAFSFNPADPGYPLPSSLSAAAGYLSAGENFYDPTHPFDILIATSDPQYAGFDFSNEIGNLTGSAGTLEYLSITDVGAVPEPTSLGLLAIGGLATLTRRRRRAAAKS